jgi:SAM-dependent methyltransferase
MTIRNKLRNAVFAVLDARDMLTGRREPMTPPRRLRTVGSNSKFRSDFTAIGKTMLGHLINVGGLRPEDRVLEVGCGVGRMPIVMTPYITTGSYDGFDLVEDSIEYCQQVITPRYPNFRFKHADIWNSTYNRQGAIQPAQFRFPYPDASFTFVFLTSVFTHMQWQEVEHYLREIARVLVPGGRVFASYFFLNSASLAAIESGAASILFKHPSEHGRVKDAADPDAASAFNEEYIIELFAASGLSITQVQHGSWSSFKTDVEYQDIVVAVKKDGAHS